MRRWQSTDGEVLSARVVEARRTIAGESRVWYRPDILDGYQPGTTELAGHRRAFADAEMTLRSYAESVVGQYPPGKRVTVYFDPANPKDSILERASAPTWA